MQNLYETSRKNNAVRIQVIGFWILYQKFPVFMFETYRKAFLQIKWRIQINELVKQVYDWHYFYTYVLVMEKYMYQNFSQILIHDHNIQSQLLYRQFTIVDNWTSSDTFC